MTMHRLVIVSLAIVAVAGLITARSLHALHGRDATTSADMAPDALDGMMDETLALVIRDLHLRPLAAPEPPSPALFELGEALFADPILSGNQNIACIDCHRSELGTGDGRARSVGEGGHSSHGSIDETGGVHLARNAPPLYNVGLPGYDRLFRDGRVAYNSRTGTYQTPEPALNGARPRRADIVRVLDGGLSAQVLFPLVEHAEMRGQPGSNELADAPSRQAVWRAIVARLLYQPRYRALFARAYARTDGERRGRYNIGHVGKALAVFIRHEFTAVNTQYDRYLRGDKGALDSEAKRGMALFFGKARCVRCHRRAHLTDHAFHALAVPHSKPAAIGGVDDRGVFPHVVDDTRSLYHFKTPPLRNVARTAPYMHNGSLQTLREVVQHYNDPQASVAGFCYADGGVRPDRQAPDIDCDRFRNRLRTTMLPPALSHPLGLSDREIDALVAFLERGLTDAGSLVSGQTLTDAEQY